MKRNVLALFARYPEAGKVKTRIARKVGDTAAKWIYERMLLRQIMEHRNQSYDFVVFLTPGHRVSSFAADHGIDTFAQKGRTLGARLSDCFRRLLKSYERVAICGSDIPGLTWTRVEEALQRTDKADVVLGPCPDGGYYLIAARKAPDAFKDIPWGTGWVLERTLNRLSRIGRSWTLLHEERDVDQVADLHLVP